ncbi:glycosyltransferase family 39 protein, partial [candidate division WOR-3 bacterium]|nr:glycosyltransferase family 39 protein [candidate division WOR-3 bacterium]
MLLIYRLGNLAYWGDEIATIDVASKPLSQLLRHLVEIDIHPPIYFLIIHFWIIPFGQSEFALRFPSIIFSILTFILVFFYLKKSKLGIASLLLFMSSPFIVMYSRMARYYSLLMFLSVLSIISLLEFINRPERKWKLLYCVSNILLLYTSYPGIILFIVENVYYLIRKKNKKIISLSTWIFMQSIVILFYLPWIYVLLFSHIGGNLTFQPLDFFLKLLYPLCSYSIGETILPWEIFITLPTFVMFYFLFFKGVLRHPKYSLTFFILPLIIGATVLSTVFVQILFPFSSSRLIFLAPIAYTIVAVGIKETKRGNILLVLLIISNLYGLFN